MLLFNGHLWHSGTRNNSKSSRRVLQCQYVLSRRNEANFEDPLQYIIGPREAGLGSSLGAQF
jgi:ectoine hydroxylase-related dioxygenase (phytanoyl-CoA dioxygenase family)